MKKRNIKNIFIIVLCVFVIIPLVFILFDMTPRMYKEALDQGEIDEINENIELIEDNIGNIETSITDIENDDDISGNIQEINTQSGLINTQSQQIQNATEPFGFSVGMEDEDEDEDSKSFQIEQVRINGVPIPGNSTTYNKEQNSCNYYIGEKSNQPNDESQNINSFEQNTYTYTYL